jgi:hypothetical protein
MSNDASIKRSLSNFRRHWTADLLDQWYEAVEVMGIGGSIQVETSDVFKGAVDLLFNGSKPRLAYGRSGQRIWKKTQKDCSKFSS